MSSDFVVSARKYRPDSWEKVVGQESITSTLKNSIASNKLGQAYLFCGPRGVGKTTCARIFAHKINEADGVNPEDLSFNIFELDAASNNSVDDIRELTSQVRIPPQVGSYNVYVIDEVHMLSQAAFNAFLKTLEEPPAHAVFILATTEKHKILPTILSRCQIFDFHRISVPAITQHLKKIAEKEEITYEEEGLHIIAQKADGALRDALSIFDQMVSFSGGNLSYQSVIENLNVLDYDYYFRVTENVLNEDISSSLVLFDEILKNGFDGHIFINGIAEHFRNLLVSKDEATVKLLEVTDGIKAKYVEQSKLFEERLIINGLDLINKCDVNYRASKNQRLLVELTLMQLCSLKYNEAEKKNSISLIPSGIEIPEISQKKQERPLPGSKPLLRKTASAPLLNEKSSNYVHATHGISMNGEIKKLEKAHQDKLDEKERIASINGEKDDVLLDKIELSEVTSGWKEFTTHLGKSGKKNLFAVLSHCDPKINEKNEIVFPVRSETDESYFNDVRQDLTEFLKGKLSVENLSLRSEGVEDTSGVQPEKKFLSEVELLKKMMKENPTLEKLKEKFDLDLK
ncbi:MAG: DNA polymerase III subunit gamma/tau [Flavobacteriales bacterium]